MPVPFVLDVNATVVVNLALFSLLLILLVRRARDATSTWSARLSSRVLLAVLLGAGFGALLQGTYGTDDPVLRATLPWIDVVGVGYVRLLQLVVSPLVFVAIFTAIARPAGPHDGRALGVISTGLVGVLLATTAMSAAIGVGVARLFHLRSDGLAQGARELARGASLTARQGEATALTLPGLLQSLVPTNAFADLSGTRTMSVAGVVVFAALLGIAARALRSDDPLTGAAVERGADALQRLVLSLVRVVVRLTPLGVLALMTRVAATTQLRDVLQLGAFVAASYVGLALILILHLAIVALTGMGPDRYIREAWQAIIFAFTSRSSAATIPLTVEAQVGGLGVPPAIASLSASIGATLGQNACAGLYPGMLAVMIAPSAGVDPATWAFAGTVILAATLGSIGIAGVGGGATIAALVVLSALNLPVGLAGVLISVEPLIDMGRTAVNVSGALTAGTVTARVLDIASHQSIASTSVQKVAT